MMDNNEQPEEVEIILNHDLEKVLDEFFDRDLEMFCSSVNEAFEVNRDIFIHGIVEQLETIELNANIQSLAHQESHEWIEIRSLSGLRNLVGGRFQTLKRRWLAAGFPLREHRGDVNDDFEVDQSGWVELSNWIYKQGYEARLTPEKDECLFELLKKGG